MQTNPLRPFICRNLSRRCKIRFSEPCLLRLRKGTLLPPTMWSSFDLGVSSIKGLRTKKNRNFNGTILRILVSTTTIEPLRWGIQLRCVILRQGRAVDWVKEQQP